jgi:DNA-binding NtrC family response regulator
VLTTMVDKPKILYVDDDELMRRAFRRVVRAQWNVFEAQSGDEALELIKEHEFAVIVCDYVLDSTNGIKLIKALKKKQPNATYILVSGASDEFEQRLDELAREGIAHFVAKPWDNKEFLALLRSLAPTS